MTHRRVALLALVTWSIVSAPLTWPAVVAAAGHAISEAPQVRKAWAGVGPNWRIFVETFNHCLHDALSHGSEIN